MRPSEIRDRVLDDHRTLRAELERLESLARGIIDGGRTEAVAELLEASESLLEQLRSHMGWEESYLLPALRDADAWGEERAERFTEDHREQRERLDVIRDRLQQATDTAVAVAVDVERLIQHLRDDMCQEEDEFLDDRVLRDDVITIGTETG